MWTRKMMLGAAGLLLGWSSPVLLGCSSGVGPKPEVVKTEIQLQLPAIPEFKLPTPNSDGSHTVEEMRLLGGKYMDQPVQISGVVVFYYDLVVCARQLGEGAVIAEPKLCEGKKDLLDCTLKIGQKMVDDKPDTCHPPHFYIGADKTASAENAIWVVDVPRPLRKDEQDDADRRKDLEKNPQPQIALGDAVVIEGTWALKSPHGFGNSDGLLVYGKVISPVQTAPKNQ